MKSWLVVQIILMALCGWLAFDELSMPHPRGWLVAINALAIGINLVGALINLRLIEPGDL